MYFTRYHEDENDTEQLYRKNVDLVGYENTDSAGHDFGFSFNSPVYKNAFNKEDNYGYEVIKAIEARETYDTEDWLIIVTSDHGGVGTGHGGPSIQERMTFVVMNKDWNEK